MWKIFLGSIIFVATCLVGYQLYIELRDNKIASLVEEFDASPMRTRRMQIIAFLKAYGCWD